ncbi:DUF551 domain-containing protein [Klebsiella grimontii]|uniref:DUF551 domain-containing protein n=1 Tax=Klebsiella grimontii TaxID=2058152 RepID=UPI0031012172
MTKSTITREQLLEIIETDHVQCGEASYLARMALAAMDSESWCLPLDYLQGHKDGLEWASQLAEANHPETGDWLYDDPIELAKAIRKGPDMPPAQPAPEYPETLPCPVLLEPGLRFGKGVKTILVLEAIQRRAEHYAELEAMPPEERAEYDAGIEAFKAMLPQSAPAVPDDLLSMAASAIEDLLEHTDPNTSYYSGVWADVPGKLRAAAPQLPGSETATVPGKWIPVSERMPIDFEAVIAFDGDQVYGEAMYSSDDGFTIDGYEPCDRLKLQNVTHWMPLPPPPTEVK